MRVPVGDIELYVHERGAGRPLILLHGGPGLDGSVWFPALEPLADEGWHLLAFDHRGNGRSDAGDPARWTVPQMADDVEAAIGELGLERPVVTGWSLGIVQKLRASVARLRPLERRCINARPPRGFTHRIHEVSSSRRDDSI